jgi:diadenylate cyclase
LFGRRAIPNFLDAFAGIQWQDLADIFLITFVLYRLYLWIQGTRALRILIALAALGLFYLLARWSGLIITTWILQYLWAVILVIVVVIFQSEIRQVLERMSPVRFFLGRPESLDRLVLEEVVRAVFELAQKRIGALVIFQRRDILEDYLKGGVPLEGQVSYEILTSIFLPSSPAHDGAVVISEGRISSMGCYLPLSDNMTLPRNYGTRHRAGIGITERGDAIALIVSEERGEVMLAVEGRIRRMANPEELQGHLEGFLVKPKPTRGRWQSALTSNLVPKIVSFALVFLLWVFIAGQHRAELRLTIPLEYRNVPANMEIAGDGASKVEVGIRGSRGMIFGITPDQVRAFVDLSQAVPGQNYFRLTLDNIRSPLGTEITKISPSSIRLQLEAVKTGSVQVKAKLTGKLPASLRLKSVWVEPAFIILQGPETALVKIREVFTDPIDLSQIRESKKIPTGLDVDSPQIHLAPNQPSRAVVGIEVEPIP